MADLSLWALPDRTIEVLTVTFFPDELTPVEIPQTLDLLDRGWRATTGTPRAWTQGDQDLTMVRVYPQPVTRTSNASHTLMDGITAADEDVVALLVTAPEITDLADWQQGLLLLRLIEREAARLGEALSQELAQAMRQILEPLEDLVRQRLTAELTPQEGG